MKVSCPYCNRRHQSFDWKCFGRLRKPTRSERQHPWFITQRFILACAPELARGFHTAPKRLLDDAPPELLPMLPMFVCKCNNVSILEENEVSRNSSAEGDRQ